MQDVIQTERLILEKLHVDDSDFVKVLVNTKGWLENIGDRNVYSKYDAISYVHKLLKTEHLFYWVVKTKEKKTSIGIISFQKRNYLEHFDIGFAFLPDFNNRGYAYEATKAVMLMAAAFPEFQTILATVKQTNLKSIRLLTKLGFRFEKEIESDNKTIHVYSNA